MSKNIYTFHYTYLITNTNTQMKYIGVRSCNCLPENDSDYMSSSNILIEAMQETPEAFTKTIIDTFPTREIANANEQWLHETYDVARNPEFYNLCIAPKKFNMCGRTHSKEARKKQSIVKMGSNNPNYGKSLSEDHKKKLSESKKGEKHYLYGKHHSEETRKKISLANKGRTHTEESKKKMGKSQIGEKNHFYGKKHSAETLENMRGTRGPQKKTTCPYCSKTGGNNVMKRWHFSNCREIA